jgi:hypothetical protein
MRTWSERQRAEHGERTAASRVSRLAVSEPMVKVAI